VHPLDQTTVKCTSLRRLIRNATAAIEKISGCIIDVRACVTCDLSQDPHFQVRVNRIAVTDVARVVDRARDLASSMVE